MRAATLGYAFVGLATLCHAGRSQAGDWTVERTDGGVTVKLAGKLVTEYRVHSGAKPILWPLVGPSGAALTRAYPMQALPAEEHDHPHQRSCWFTHGNVNGIDFWSEQPGHGMIEHQAFDLVEGGSQASIRTRNDWLAPGGRKVCTDERSLTFREDDGRRLIDFDITLRPAGGPVVFGDTKEGSFGLRVASTMRVDSKQGGRIVNSESQTDAGAWGRRAAWVDYHGPAGGETAGIAVLNHPSSFRSPTYWHVRTYGLFAANPFGVHDFTGAGDGSFTLEPGKSLMLRYRLVLHAGDEKQARIAELYDAYAKEP